MEISKRPPILPYTWVVGQDSAKTALELSFIAPRIGGVLISGQRGTAKSTVVRAFALMMFGSLPVTLPINATDDRVVGGWEVPALLAGQPKRKEGLLEEAGRKGLLYIDEVNLLDDHVVNLILDVVSTGVLPVQREALDDQEILEFRLVGTMNPEEGGLRPQLLDRFGLLVDVVTESNEKTRFEILQKILEFDSVCHGGEASPELVKAVEADAAVRQNLEEARQHIASVALPDEIVWLSARVAARFQVAGHRGDHVMALAAQALAARENCDCVEPHHLRAVAKMALTHRRVDVSHGGPAEWTDEEEDRLAKVLAGGE